MQFITRQCRKIRCKNLFLIMPILMRAELLKSQSSAKLEGEGKIREETRVIIIYSKKKKSQHFFSQQAGHH